MSNLVYPGQIPSGASTAAADERAPSSRTIAPNGRWILRFNLHRLGRSSTNTRQLNEEIKLMFNASCEGAPKPQTPDPLEWGRGRGAPGAVGFNVAVTKVSNQQPACELFYEVEARAGRQRCTSHVIMEPGADPRAGIRRSGSGPRSVHGFESPQAACSSQSPSQMT